MNWWKEIVVAVVALVVAYGSSAVLKALEVGDLYRFILIFCFAYLIGLQVKKYFVRRNHR